ncbi:hypothetical protein Taro_004556 [Colocasia esculenta]|uniref:Uncharacterized protein n=1 Tax=Colocasia esculenta TaxID=4460 RepID=A0A843TMC7_COLES|nr:hypothetical protein [Colocasia esculenta]
MSTQRAPLLLALFLASLALANADLYGNPSPPALPPPSAELAPPPPFAVKGKKFPPESTFCIDPNATCFGKTVKCPSQCPMAKPSDPTAKGCYVDCRSAKCEATCRKRRPNCEGSGAACYDPRFVGGDGIMFYFHGKSNHHFSLVSDPNLQINARFIGLRPAGRPRDFTWIQALGLMFGPHTFTMEARRASAWDAAADHFDFTYDGAPVPLDNGHLSSWSVPDSQLLVERTATVNSVTVTLPRVFEIMASVVPVTREDDRVHKYGIPADDCFAHLEVQFKLLGLSEEVEGVLGQTYRPGFRNPVKRGVPMPVMSGEHRYLTSSLLSANCKYCTFSPAVSTGVKTVLALDPWTATLDCTSKSAASNGYGVVCRR